MGARVSLNQREFFGEEGKEKFKRGLGSRAIVNDIPNVKRKK